MDWIFARQLRPFVLVAGAASLLLNLALLMPALYMLQVFDRVFASGSIETLVMLSGLVMLALTFGYFMDTVRARVLGSAGRALERRLSPAALTSMLRQAAGTSGRPEDDVMRDITQLRGFLSGNGIVALFDAPWVPIYLLIIGVMHPLLGLSAAIGAGLLVALGALTERTTRENTERALRGSRSISRHVDSLARNAEAIVGMGMTGAAVAGWQTRHTQLMETQQQLGHTSARLAAVARILRQTLQIVLLALGAWLVIGRQASPGIMIAATILLGRALQPVECLISGWKALIEARSAWRRLSARPALESVSRLALPAPQGRLEVERVTFATAPMRPALIRNIGFALTAGESLGLVGPSASGKTTLVRLLLGIWKPQVGTVRLDGADVSRWDRDALGQHIGYLPQDVELFSGTVAENIARFSAVSPEAVVKAAQLARVHEMILRLPEGYDTQIGDAGAVLSGGQRQRVALARAVFGTPKFVVLDEPNANLDHDGEERLLDAIRTLKEQGATLVVIAHRPSVLRYVDKVLVMKNGAIEAFGPRDQIVPKVTQPQAAASGAAPAVPAATTR